MVMSPTCTIQQSFFSLISSNYWVQLPFSELLLNPCLSKPQWPSRIWLIISLTRPTVKQKWNKMWQSRHKMLTRRPSRWSLYLYPQTKMHCFSLAAPIFLKLLLIRVRTREQHRFSWQRIVKKKKDVKCSKLLMIFQRTLLFRRRKQEKLGGPSCRMIWKLLLISSAIYLKAATLKRKTFRRMWPKSSLKFFKDATRTVWKSLCFFEAFY